MVAAGTLDRPSRGVYALPRADPATVAAVTAGGVVTCLTAAHRWGLPLLSPPAHLHLAVPRTTSTSIRALLPAGTVLLWDSTLEGGGSGGAGVARALWHVARCLPLPEAVAVLDAAVARGLVGVGELRRSRPSRDAVTHERVLRHVDATSGSIAESIARVALVGAGFDVSTQVHLAGVGQVDFLVDGLVEVEIDGFAYHSGRAEFRHDRRRDRVIAIDHGLLELRFAFEDVVHDVPGFVETVRRAVAAAAVRGVRPA